jgi:hypothetical protein
MGDIETTHCGNCHEAITQDPDSGEWVHVRSDEMACASWESNAEPAKY